MKRNLRVLFVYPGLYMQLGLPLGIPILASWLKKEGVEVRAFETIFYQEPGDIDVNLERFKTQHSVRPISYDSVGISRKNSAMCNDFMKVVDSFKPDLVGLSSAESNFQRGMKLINRLKKKKDIPVVVGGVFASMAPEVVIRENSVDMVCIGEGEQAIVDLCRCLRDKKDCSGIKNLWVKKAGRVVKNSLSPPRELASEPAPDFSIFEESVFFRPMRGRIFRTIPMETSRGCPYRCSYCCAPALNKLYKDSCSSGYFRSKTMPDVLAEIDRCVSRYSPEFFYFTSETFLATTEDDFDCFIKGYGRLKIPFWIQTRPETISSERIRRLKEVGLYWMSIGVEHGNEEFRRKYLKRFTTNEKIIEAIRILDRLALGASINSIIGFPFETRKLIFDTIDLNRELFMINSRLRCTISIFTPFRGCELYNLCLAHKLIEPLPYISSTNLIGGSVLKSRHLSREELDGIFRVFSFYVHLPRRFRPKIAVAEKFDRKGNQEFRRLSEKVNEYLCCPVN